MTNRFLKSCFPRGSILAVVFQQTYFNDYFDMTNGDKKLCVITEV